MLRHTLSLVAAASVVPLALLVSGCQAEVEPAPAYVTTGAVYDAEPAPVNIETYPSVVYEGHPSYFYNNHWYYRDRDSHWTYYRQEPPELHRRRPVMQAAPPAHRVDEPRRDEPRREEPRSEERDDHERR